MIPLSRHLGNGQPPKPLKPSIFAWPPRDLSDDGTCRTFRRALTTSSRSRTPAARAVYDSPSSSVTRPTSPHPSFMLSCRSVHNVGRRDSVRHLRIPRSKSTRVHPRTFHLAFTSRRRSPHRTLHLHFTTKATINTKRLSITHHASSDHHWSSLFFDLGGWGGS